MSVIPPVPEAAQAEPGPATQVQLAAVRPVGSASTTATPSASLGPLFDTVMVYVVIEPGVTDVSPSVFTTEMSPVRSIVVVSVDELSPGSGSVVPAGAATVAVLRIEPLPATTVAVTENVTTPPTGTVTGSAIGPVPLAAQAPPSAPTQVHDTDPSCAGGVSVTTAPTASDGPAFVTTTL